VADEIRKLAEQSKDTILKPDEQRRGIEFYIRRIPMGNNIEFDSEFGNVKYIEKDNIVLLTWKKFCCFDDYRKPGLFASELLKNFPCSNFVVDARHGFEDDKEDVAWGFTVLLPAMAQTDCKYFVFIMEDFNEIEEEMDMWTKECSKYFIVKKVRNYEEAVRFCLK
jgi:hypothetical protein